VNVEGAAYRQPGGGASRRRRGGGGRSTNHLSGRSSNPHPAGEGLRWIAHGFSALGLSDHEILEREFSVYDALYAECRKRLGVAH
jgi:hypothetical protein